MITPLTVGEGWFAVGGLFLVLAYLIKVREWTFLIAGYDETVNIPRGLAANVVGNFILRVGIAAVVIGVVGTVMEISNLGLIFAAVVIIDLIRVIYRLNTYVPPESTPG